MMGQMTSMKRVLESLTCSQNFLYSKAPRCSTKTFHAPCSYCSAIE